MKTTDARRAYLAVNIIFAGVILLIMGYSGFYSPEKDNYPVTCIHELLTGKPCPSCGLSHAFSLILRGRFEEALQWNYASVRVFSFLALQLMMRIALGIRCFLTDRHLKKISVTDAVISSVLALIAFYPFLKATWLALV